MQSFYNTSCDTGLTKDKDFKIFFKRYMIYSRCLPDLKEMHNKLWYIKMNINRILFVQ